jgi:hypothetical protein
MRLAATSPRFSECSAAVGQSSSKAKLSILTHRPFNPRPVLVGHISGFTTPLRWAFYVTSALGLITLAVFRKAAVHYVKTSR